MENLGHLKELEILSLPAKKEGNLPGAERNQEYRWFGEELAARYP